MKTAFEIVADTRGASQGKGASRRLRHAGKVPAILYGGHIAPQNITLDHQSLLTMLEKERFYTSILSLRIGDEKHTAILKDIQRHPAKKQILHLDLQRVLDNEPIRMNIPLHFINANIAPGVKTGGGQVSHLLNEVEVVCLPKDLPEYIEVDMAAMEMNDSKHLSDLVLPANVELVLLSHGRDEAVVSVHHARVAEEAAAPAAGAEAAPAAAAPAKAGAAPAKAAAAAPAKKEGGKK
jgi:large subunit ribosomal protein L25